MKGRYIVCGSRGWHDRQRISDRLALLPGTDETVVVHGACPRGADRIAHQEAQKLGLLVEPHPADWDGPDGKRAGFVRNEEMAALGAELCIAFWDGRSNGTRDMTERAEAHGIPVELVLPSLGNLQAALPPPDSASFSGLPAGEEETRCRHGKSFDQHCKECQLRGYCACPECEAEA